MKTFKSLFSIILLAVMSLTISLLFSLPFVPVLAALIAVGSIPQVSGVLRVVVSNPLIGKSRQSMGNATFATWKGINVLKEKPQSVANPNSDGQQQQRSAFSQMVTAFRNMPAVVRAGFKKLAVKKSEFNAFTSYNLKNAFDMSAPPAATFVPADALISKGTISSTAAATNTADRSNNTIVVTWSHAVLQPGQSNADLAIIAAYNVTKNDWYGEVTSALRSADTGSITLPADWAVADSVQVYLAFYNEASGESSDSTNANTAIVA